MKWEEHGPLRQIPDWKQVTLHACESASLSVEYYLKGGLLGLNEMVTCMVYLPQCCINGNEAGRFQVPKITKSASGYFLTYRLMFP